MTKEQMFQTETLPIEKNKTRLSRLIPLAVYLGIWALALISFWFFTDLSNAMGYNILYFWLLLPITTFIVSLLIGKSKAWGNSKWFLFILFGLMYMLLEYLTFSMANRITFGNKNLPQYEMLLWGAAISLVGLSIGSLIKSARKQPRY